MKLKIEQDIDPLNPRTEDNILGKMVCFHKRYNLGDKHDIDFHDYTGWDEMETFIRKQNPGCVLLALYLYDHSTPRISTKPFSCPWDSGQVGFIYVTRETVLEEAPIHNPKYVTKRVREWAEDYLQSEVTTYNTYLQGDVYGYIIEDDDGNELDSCWGFDDFDYCKKEGEAVMRALL